MQHQGAFSGRLFVDRLLGGLAAGAIGRRSWCVAPLVLALGLAITWLLAAAAQRAALAELRARFEGRVAIAEVEITRRVARTEVALRGLRAAYAVHGRLNRREFATFVASRDLERDVPGVRGLGFVERVDRAQLDAFVARERADHGADFHVASVGTAPELYVIKLIEPLERNRAAWGFDVGSEPVRREAIERAVDTGQGALSAPLTLVQDREGGPGWLNFVPVYAGQPRDTAGRRASLVGVLYAPIVAKEVFADAKTTLGAQVDFQLFDGDPAQGRLVFDSGQPSGEGAVTAAALARFDDRLFREDREATVGGRRLVLRLASAGDATPTLGGWSWAALVTGAAGTLLSLLLSLSACLLIQGRRRALDLAEQMTGDLQRAAAEAQARNERLRADEELMRVVTDNLPAAVTYWDADLRCRFANRAFLQQRALSREDALGRPVQELLGEADFARVRPVVPRALAGEAQQLELQDEPGVGARTRLVHVIPDLDGQQVRGLFAIALDITDMKRVRDLAVQASAAKSLFLANMSHEIRTPMNAVLGMLTLLKDSRLDARQLDFAVRAETSARSLLSLLNDILDFSKVEAGQIALDPHPFRLDELLGGLSVILSASAGAKDIELVFDIDSAVPGALVGDDLRLGQVLINLAGNAVKFTEHGEVVVRLRVQPTAAGDAQVQVEVRDTGIGIAPQHLQRIFQPFDQAEASTTRRFGGTGLGLAISQRLVQLMGGQIEVTSEPGRGSCFRFTLVLPQAPARPLAPATPAEPCRVLVADDNASARAALATLARSQGWQADVAATGAEVLERLQQPGDRYDAVLLDWNLPGFDGWQAAARIRGLAGGHRLVLILLVTGPGREVLARRSPQEQMLLDGVLVKPVTATMLAEALRQARSAPSGASLPLPGAAAPLAGLRVLVVEDNLNNQIVARELLARQGAQVEIAADGEQAVAMVAGAVPPGFDVVLMDLQMPVMDGFTATRAIREQLGRVDLPIIAMTANAMESDRAACLAAGMVDHIGKPIVLAHLVEVLQRHTRRAPSPGPAAVEAPVPPPASGAPVRLDRAAAIDRLGGSPELYEQVLDIFRDTLPVSCAELREHLAAGRRADASRIAHSIKGGAGTVGADLLAQQARLAEAALAGPPGPGDTAAVDGVLGEAQAVLAQLTAG